MLIKVRRWRTTMRSFGQFGATAETLRRFTKQRRFWLPDDTCILMTVGEVDAGNGIGGAEFD